MSEISTKIDEHIEPTPPTGEELALRVFTVTMTGVCGAILLMIVMGDY